MQLAPFIRFLEIRSGSLWPLLGLGLAFVTYLAWYLVRMRLSTLGRKSRVRRTGERQLGMTEPTAEQIPRDPRPTMGTPPALRTLSDKRDFRGLRILLIDDELSLIEALALQLRMLGAVCETHSEPERALAEARQKPFDFVLCDLQLPGISGDALVSQILKVSSKGLHVVFMTGNPYLDAAQLSIRGSNMILKPFEFQELLDLFVQLQPHSN